MSQFVVKLCILITLFMMLVEAGRTRGQGSGNCATKGCPSGKHCGRYNGKNVCLVPHGGSCTPSDMCDGGYYCLWGNTCDGEKRSPEGAACSGIDCMKGLYCDLNEHKCLKIGNDSPQCYGNAECASKCHSPKGCYCANLKCVPK